MGVDARPVLVVGIRAEEFYSTETKVSEFEVHDKKGNPTGVIEKERTTVVTSNVGGKRIEIEGGGRPHVEEIAELLDLKNVRGYDNKFGIQNLIYEHEGDRMIVGIQVAEINAMYQDKDFKEIKQNEVIKAMNDVKMEVLNRFKKNVEPGIFLYGGCSY